ncbi:unnamed protein product [Adineta ricciae]|uniref:Uncharacterized protein n=1 Tax=Adineta ricciae TaxID=249248 RepID=A0A815Z677_ADIRI|nr:unnamed protein product [Adineta ricciae]
MDNRFSPVNAYSKSSFGDFRGVNGSGRAEVSSASKQQHIQQSNQTIDQQRRITYRSNDHSWNDHNNNTHVSPQAFRTDSLNKNKLSSSTRQFSNGTSHENVATSMPHLSTTPLAHHQSLREDLNQADSHISSGTKSRLITRNQKTSINLEKTSGSNGFNLPTRGNAYHSTRLDANIYPRQATSKQRTHVSSKSSLHDPNAGDVHLNGIPDENSYYFPQQVSVVNNPQRLNSSTFDISASRKPFFINKSTSLNTATNGNYNSARELHRSDTTVDKTTGTRFTIRGTSASKQRKTSSMIMMANAPNERERSAQSYKSRDPNVSYAYTNVKKYIEENDLMTPEKEHSIQNWIVDVEKHRHEFQKLE